MDQIHETLNYFQSSIRRIFLEEKGINQKLAGNIIQIYQKAEKRKKKALKKFGGPIPTFCMFSVTWKCNLSCKGCYARNYPQEGQLKLNEIINAISELILLGNSFFIIVGGEPLAVPGLIESLAKQKDGFFFLFTNGYLLNDEKIGLIKNSGNILPVLSIEGSINQTDARRGNGSGKKTEENIIKFKNLGMPFAFSSMISKENYREISSRDYFDNLWKSGALFGFMIDYVPMPGRNDEALLLSDDESVILENELDKRRKECRPFFFHFPADEYRMGGCQSAGKGFFHINANGFAEPCPFSHFACDNIRDKSIPEILQSEFFQKVRNDFSGCISGHAGCLLVEKYGALSKLTERTGAFNTETLNV